jgi:protein gp37
MHPQWARSLRDACQATGVAFFFKQNGEYVSVSEVEGPGAHYSFPDGATVRRTGKKAAGRLLDGRTWDEMPEARR